MRRANALYQLIIIRECATGNMVIWYWSDRVARITILCGMSQLGGKRTRAGRAINLPRVGVLRYPGHIGSVGLFLSPDVRFGKGKTMRGRF